MTDDKTRSTLASLEQIVRDAVGDAVADMTAEMQELGENIREVRRLLELSHIGYRRPAPAADHEEERP